MKKLILAGLLLSSIGMGFISCQKNNLNKIPSPTQDKSQKEQ